MKGGGGVEKDKCADDLDVRLASGSTLYKISPFIHPAEIFHTTI